MRVLTGPGWALETLDERTRHTPEQVINKLREADAMLSSGRSMAQVLQHLGVGEQTFHRWRNQYGGMKSEEADRVNDVETLSFMKPRPAARCWRVPAPAG